MQLVQAVASMIRLDSTPEMISILSKFANVPVDILVSEIKLLKYLPATDGKPDFKTNNESIHSWLDYMKTNNYIQSFNGFFTVLKLFSVIPVTSCSCERVFSKLTIVKNKLRNSMQQDRLDSLVLMFTEQEITSSVNRDTVIEQFKNMGNRRMHL